MPTGLLFICRRCQGKIIWGFSPFYPLSCLSFCVSFFLFFLLFFHVIRWGHDKQGFQSADTLPHLSFHLTLMPLLCSLSFTHAYFTHIKLIIPTIIKLVNRNTVIYNLINRQNLNFRSNMGDIRLIPIPNLNYIFLQTFPHK